ncbi:MAG: peptidoglycan editing factor PgeF [Rhodothermales bacterium]
MMYIQPQTFRPHSQIVAGFSTRLGGVSSGAFDSLNLGLSTKDKKEDVLANRRRLFEPLGFSIDALAITGQVHGVELIEVDKPGLYVGYDAIITQEPDVLLCLSAADCASVLIADPENNIIGACHAGWRGTVGQIVSKTVQALLERGACVETLKAYVSPCISREHFEVGIEVANQFDPAFVYSISGKPKPHVDLKKAIQSQLLEKGLAEDAIEVSPYCTFANTDQFYSYRAEEGNTGRLMGFIGMKKQGLP